MLCRHCQHKKANRPRGLCFGCYYAPGVREQYQPTSPFAHRGVTDTYSTRPLPAQPTNAPAGSAEKINVLMERAAAQTALWHPADAMTIDHSRRGGSHESDRFDSHEEE